MKYFLTLLVLLGARAEAGTYNFYFNNAEQGKNSSANPSVSVNTPDGEENKEKAEPVTEEASPAAPALLTKAPEDVPTRRNFRAFASLMRAQSVFPKQDFTGREAKDDDFGDSLPIDVVAGFGFYPFRHFGMNLMAGTHSHPATRLFAAAEVEFLPLQTEAFELGILGGAWTLPRYKTVSDGFDPSFFGKKYKSDGMGGLYAGARLGFKLPARSTARTAWMISGGVRANHDYVNVDAGLGMMF